MKHISKKFVPSLVLMTLLLVVGGFCDMSVVSAAGSEMGMQMTTETQHCGMDSTEGIQKAGPMDNVLMPCCIEKHDNSTTVLPVVSSERTKFSEIAAVNQSILNPEITEDRTYVSSPSPPPKADILSSVVLIE